MIRLTTFFGGLTKVLISDPVYPPYIRNVSKRLMYYISSKHIVMYANIADHRAVRSWFLRLIVNVVICAPWGCA